MTVIPAGLVSTILFTVLDGSIEKPVSPVCVLKVTPLTSRPAGAVHAVPSNGVLVQYSNSTEPTLLTVGISKLNVCEVTADGKELPIRTDRLVSGEALTLLTGITAATRIKVTTNKCDDLRRYFHIWLFYYV